MKAIELTAFGDPRSVLRLGEINEPLSPAPGEMLLQMLRAPVNHNDLLLIKGTFPVRPSLPSPIGNEGVGRVLSVGEGVSKALIGQRVLAPLYGRTWVERAVFPAEGAVPLPAASIDQLSMLRINPPTAALLLSEYVALEPGSWVIQNAANSSVGRAVIAFARDRGLRTINLVRRVEFTDELRDAGADIVLADTEESIARIADLVSGAPVQLALDAIGDTATARLAGALSAGGTLVSYAQMGAIAAPGDLRPLMRKGITLTSFYQAKAQYAPKIPGILARATEMVSDGRLFAPVAATYPAARFAEAIAHTMSGGKVLLDLSPGAWG